MNISKPPNSISYANNYGRPRARASIVWRVFNVGKLRASLLLGADSTPLPAVKHTLAYVVAVAFFCLVPLVVGICYSE